jgi:hypothetical protein
VFGTVADVVAVRAAAPDSRQLREVAARTRPVVLAGERVLPVVPALAPLFPDGGLRRGSTVCVGGGAAASSLALAVVAAASSLGSWCAAVGWPSLGVAAAAELGVALERFPLVAWPSGGASSEGPTIVAALLDAFDVVLVRAPGGPGRGLRLGDARRLSARARERGAVLVHVGTDLEGADVRLTTERPEWHGLGDGHGHLTGRTVDVSSGGRGAASRERRVRVWLPAPDGGVAEAEFASSHSVAVFGPREAGKRECVGGSR